MNCDYLWCVTELGWFACDVKVPAIHLQLPDFGPGAIMASAELVGTKLRLFPVNFRTDKKCTVQSFFL